MNDISQVRNVGFLEAFLKAALVCCLMSSVLLSEELFFVVVILYIVLYLLVYKSVVTGYKNIPSFICLAYFCSILMSINLGIYNNELSNVVKDFWYFFKPYIYVWFALMIVRLWSIAFTIKVVTVLSVIAGVVYLVPIISSGFSGFENTDEFRDEFGTGSILFSVNIIVVSLFRKYVQRGLFYFVLIFNLILIVVSSSRIDFLYMILLLLFFIRPSAFTMNKLGVFILLLFALIVPKSDYIVGGADTRENFIEKIMFSVNEIRPGMIYFDDDIHQRWRGYESYLALNQFQYEDPVTLFFGNGLGSPVYTDFAKRARIDDETHFKLEWLHNGFVTIFFKCGIFGLLVVVLLIFIIARIGDLDCRRRNVFLLIFIILSTYFTGGIMNKSGVFFIVLPFILNLAHSKRIKVG